MTYTHFPDGAVFWSRRIWFWEESAYLALGWSVRREVPTWNVASWFPSLADAIRPEAYTKVSDTHCYPVGDPRTTPGYSADQTPL